MTDVKGEENLHVHQVFQQENFRIGYTCMASRFDIYFFSGYVFLISTT